MISTIQQKYIYIYIYMYACSSFGNLSKAPEGPYVPI